MLSNVNYFKCVFLQIWLQLFGVWCTFCVSLILFPAIQSNILMVREEFEGENGTEYRTVLFSEEFGMCLTTKSSVFIEYLKKFVDNFCVTEVCSFFGKEFCIINDMNMLHCR